MPPTLRAPRELPVLCLLLLVSAGMALFVPAFRTVPNLIAAGENAAFIGIMACGEALVLLSGGLDLSVGAVLALSSCATAALLASGVAPVLAMAGGLLAGALAGLVNGALVTWRGIPPILATLGTLFIFRYGTAMVTAGRNYGPFPAAVDWAGTGWAPFCILLAALGMFALFVQCARPGRWLLAAGGSEPAARLSGLPVDAVRRWAYLLSGLCAAVAGLVVMGFNDNTQSSVGMGYELDVIAACVLGGVRVTGGDGSILGAVLGAAAIAVLRDAFVLTHRPPGQDGLITGGVILLAALAEELRVRRAAVHAAV